MKQSIEMFYTLQYDRIDKLETRRENFSNYVLTITAAIFTFGFSFLKESTFLVLIFVMLINCAAIIFIAKTRPWIKLHQIRAEKAAEIHFPELNNIKKDAENEYFKRYPVKKSKRLNFTSDKDNFRRSRVYSYLHLATIVLSVFLIMSSFGAFSSENVVKCDCEELKISCVE